MKLVTIDWLIIAAYFILSLIIGLYYARRAGRSTEEYFLSDRSMPWWLAGTSMVATTFAADTPLAVTEMVARNGVAGNWLWWSMLLSGMLTVFFFSLRHTNPIPIVYRVIGAACAIMRLITATQKPRHERTATSILPDKRRPLPYGPYDQSHRTMRHY